jgi:hypothetical protein
MRRYVINSDGTLRYMARIRAVEIDNFRGIKHLVWIPSPGINCLIGPGDSGKSSILDAIDFCLTARRNIQFTDADFHKLDVEKPITISVTIGELYDELKSLEAYGPYLRSFDAESGTIEDEPENEAETVLTVRLFTIGRQLRLLARHGLYLYNCFRIAIAKSNCNIDCASDKRVPAQDQQ